MSDSTLLPEGILSLLDTDLYKLTMQSAVLKYFPDVGLCSFGEARGSRADTNASLAVTYAFTNRTPDMKLSRVAYLWLQTQISSERAKTCRPFCGTALTL